MTDLLIIAIGNIGRKDDGIGWVLLDRLRELGFKGPCEYRYQLNVEDAELAARHDKVLIIDASTKRLERGFRLQRVEAERFFEFSTHRLSPGAIASLCRDLYGASPEIELLEVAGHDWGMGHHLSDEALLNTELAVTSVLPLIFQKTEAGCLPGL